MINIIDTCRNVLGDKYAVIKLLIMAVPVLLCVNAYLSGQIIVSNTLNAVICIIFAAIFFETIRRSCTSEPMLMPSFLMPVRMFITLGFTIIAGIPAAIVCGFIILGYFELLKNFPNIQQDTNSYWIVTGIFVLVTLSLFFASVTQFLNSGKIYDSYNPIKIVKALNTFIINFLFFSIQNAIFFGIVALIPVNLIYVVAGFKYDNFFIYLYSSFYFALNFVMLADFIAQTKKESECN